MKVRTCRFPGIAYFAYEVAALDFLSGRDEDFTQMGETGGIAVAVVYIDGVAVAAVPSRFGHGAVACGIDRGARRCGEIHAVMMLGGAVDRVDTPPVSRCHLRHVLLRYGLYGRDMRQAVAALVDGLGKTVERLRLYIDLAFEQFEFCRHFCQFLIIRQIPDVARIEARQAGIPLSGGERVDLHDDAVEIVVALGEIVHNGNRCVEPRVELVDAVAQRLVLLAQLLFLRQVDAYIERDKYGGADAYPFKQIFGPGPYSLSAGGVDPLVGFVGRIISVIYFLAHCSQVYCRRQVTIYFYK